MVAHPPPLLCTLRASQSILQQQQWDLQPAAPPRAGGPVSGAGLIFAREKSQKGAGLWFMPFLSLSLFQLRERPQALGGGGHPPTHPTAGPKGSSGSHPPNHDHPARLVHASPLLSPLPSKELKPMKTWSCSVSRPGSSLLGEQRNLGLLAHWDSFHCTTKTQHRQGKRHSSKKPTALPIYKGVSNCPQPARGSLRPAAHTSTQGALCARWHLSPPSPYPDFPWGPRAGSLQRGALAAPASTCRVPARSRARLSGAVGRQSCSARAGRHTRAGTHTPLCCSPLACRGAGLGQDENKRDWRHFMPPWQSSPTQFPGWFHRPEAMQQDGLGTGSPKASVAPGDPNHSPRASKKGKEWSASAHAAACTGTDGSCPGVALGTSPRLTLQLLKSLCHGKKNEQERSQAATSPTREFTCRAAHGQQRPRRARQHRLARMALPTLPINPLLQTGTLVCKPPSQGTDFPAGRAR